MGFTKRELIQFMDGLAELAGAENKINVRIQKAPKPDAVITVQVSLEKDLKSCMRCAFFYDCPYRQSERYCFPCMKKLLGRTGMETEKFVLEEEQDG